MAFTFRGGIHPFDGKAMSKDKAMQEIFPEGEMVYPLSQHIGKPAKPIVGKGDRVLMGQKIAEADGFVSSPIYASVSGTIKGIEKRRVLTGDMVMSIVLDNDGNYEEAERIPVRPIAEMSRGEVINIIKEMYPDESK